MEHGEKTTPQLDWRKIMNILYIAEEIKVPDFHGGSTHVQETINALEELGHKVFVVCEKGSKQKSEEARGKVKYFRISMPTSPFKKNLFLFTNLGKICRKILEENQIDLVWQRYRIFGCQGVIMGKKAGVKTLIELNEPIETSDKNIFYPFIKKWFLHTIKYADLVFGQHECEVHLAPKEKQRIFTNGANPKTFNPKKTGKKLRQKFGLKGKTLIYTGSFADWHCLKNLIYAFERIAKKQPMAKLLLIGKGPQEKGIKELVKERNIKGVLFLGEIPLDKLAYYVNASEAGVALFDRNYPAIKRFDYFYSPVKVFDYKACAKPIIASGIGNLLPLVRNGINGYSVNEQSIEEIANAIELIFDYEEKAQKMGQNNLKDIKQKYNWINVTKGILGEMK